MIKKKYKHFTILDSQTGSEYTIETADFRERDRMFHFTDEQWGRWLEAVLPEPKARSLVSTM